MGRDERPVVDPATPGPAAAGHLSSGDSGFDPLGLVPDRRQPTLAGFPASHAPSDSAVDSDGTGGDSLWAVTFRPGMPFHRAGRRPSASRAKRMMMAMGPGGRWRSRGWRRPRRVRSPARRPSSRQPRGRRHEPAFPGGGRPRRPRSSNQESKDQHRHISSRCPDAGDGSHERARGRSPQEPGKVVYLDRTVVVDAIDPWNRIELLELCRCETGWDPSFARCDVTPRTAATTR